MKMTTVVKSSVFAAALGLACLLPATTHAQADVSPDIYEVVSTDTVVAEQQVQAAANATKPADFQGHFALPYEVRCKGKSLKSGQYALSVKSEGTGRVVTITRNGETMNIRAQELTGNPAASHSTVLVRKSHEGRLLEAVYVRQLNVLLYLDTNAATQPGRMERLPIS
ncbi:MAG: hypothetical protein WB723_21190 [Candidatus Acidiferrales bacterium]